MFFVLQSTGGQRSCREPIVLSADAELKEHVQNWAFAKLTTCVS